jgi:hypothetical protein
MPDGSVSLSITRLVSALPWSQIFTDLWDLSKRTLSKLSMRGMYHVLEHEVTLELLDDEGKRATFKKRKRVRYLQDNIIAYQDYAWGDGEILLNYRTSRGKPVDRYRSGFKTYILLSLREVKNRGDVDEFHIHWDIRDGFLTEDGFWGLDISQHTDQIQLQVIFPKSRPPVRLFLEESNRKRTRPLGEHARQQLPDGRWLVTWETSKPRLHELYVLRWIW